MSEERTLAVVKKDAAAFLAIGNNLVSKAEKAYIQMSEDVQIARAILKQCQEAEGDIESKRVEITKPLNDFIKEVNVLFKETTTPILTAKNTIKTKILAYEQEQERIKKEAEAKRFAEEQARLKRLEEERLERERIEAKKRAEEEAKLKAEQERLRKLEEARIEKELLAKKANEDEQKKIREEAEKQRIDRELLEKEKLQIEQAKRDAEEERKRLEEEKKIIEAKKAADEEAAMLAAKLKVKGVRSRWSFEIVNEEEISRAYCSPDSKKINEAIKAGVREIKGLRIFEATNVQ